MEESSIEKKYVIACMRHTGTGEYAVKLWGPNSNGYTVDLNKAGRYNETEAALIHHGIDDFPIEETVAQRMSFECEYNYNGWERATIIRNNEVFWNTFNISKKQIYKSGSNKQWFRYIK